VTIEPSSWLARKPFYDFFVDIFEFVKAFSDETIRLSTKQRLIYADTLDFKSICGTMLSLLAREQGSKGAREQGSKGAREQGSKGAREQGSKGAREQGLSRESVVVFLGIATILLLEKV